MATPVSKSETENQEANRLRKRRNRWLILLTVVFLLAGAIWFLYWFLEGRFYINTEDAYVTGNQVMLTPQVAAGVKAIYADETDLVEQGQLVVELDPSNYQIRVEDLKQSLADTVREVAVLFQQVHARAAEVTLREAQYRQAKLDYQHRVPLVKTGAVSVEEFETYETSVDVSAAQVEFAKRELEAAQALVEGTTVATHPRVLEAGWKLKDAYLNLIRCQIWAPVTGYIAKRTVQVGDQVPVGQTLLYIVPLNDIWLEANYKETQLRRVRIGQPVTYTADLYGGDVEYHGTVLGFQPGSGNAFALLPPENASGNWIKIIQRVPVRISVNPDELIQHPLFLGLSMRVSVDAHEDGGKMLAKRPTLTPLYTTSIYDKQIEEMEEMDSIIKTIVQDNIDDYNQCN